MRYIKDFWKRLDRRLITIVCLAVLPIIFLAIWFSSMAIDESKEKVILSQTNEFNLLGSQDRVNLQTVNRWIADYIQSSLKQIAQPRYFSSVFSITATNDIAKNVSDNKFSGFVFVKEHQENEKLYLKSIGKTIPIEQMTKVKEDFVHIVLESELPAIGHGIREINGVFYYITIYSLQNYTLGYSIDLQQMLTEWNTSLLIDCKVSIQDGEVGLVTDSSGKYILGQKDPDSLISQCSIGEMMMSLFPGEDGEKVPFAHVMLRILAWGSIGLLLLLWILIQRQVIHPLLILQNGMKQLETNHEYRIEQKASTNDFSYLYHSFNQSAEIIQHSHEKDLLIYQTQLNNLKLQVNPHMLLNSLTMIYSLAQTRQTELIQKFTMLLVEYFRYCLRDNNDLVPLESEMKFVATYMELQKTRFPGELSYAYYMEEELETILIPPLLIQNFVENATKYARTSEHPIEVLIWIRREAEKLMITIEDTGKGIEESILQKLNAGESIIDSMGKKHIGIWNCRKRMDMFYGDQASLNLESQLEKGTKVHLSLPVTMEEEAKK